MSNENNIPNISFRIREAGLEDDLSSRVGGFNTSVHQVAQRDLHRYYEVLRQSLPSFSEKEARLILDVLNGTLTTDPGYARLLWAEFDDTPQQIYDHRGVEKEPFVELVRGLSFAQSLAVIDAAERFWKNPNKLSLEDVGLSA